MSIRNNISKGLHQDFNEHDQPDGTMRDNRNGIITGSYGTHSWSNFKGMIEAYASAATSQFLAHCNIRNRSFILTLNTTTNVVDVHELFYSEAGIVSSSNSIWSGSNSVLNISLTNPIRSILGFYENDLKQYIYFTDGNNQPRVLNVAATGAAIAERFLDFFPIADPVFGNIKEVEILESGNCKAGTYFITWRLFKNGYFTPWKALSNPIAIVEGLPFSTYKEYQAHQGAAPNENVSKSIKLTIENIDDGYDSIQIAAMYSNDYNSAEPGFIFYDGLITGDQMVVTIIGNEYAGALLIDDIIRGSILIESCKEITEINKQLVLSNIEEREEIDVSSLHPDLRNDQMIVEMEPITHPVLLDTRQYPGEIILEANEALHGTRPASSYSIFLNGLLPKVWYKASTPVTFTDDDGPQAFAAGELFRVNSTERVVGTGTAEMVIVRSKYIPFGADPADINTWELDVKEMPVNTSYNFKNPLFTKYVKGYPGDEQIRFGIVFVDKTGRPFFARHLYNSEIVFEGHTIGPGDLRTPGRQSDSNNFKIHDAFDHPISGDHDITVSNSIGVRISGIDITPFKDRIGGFYIVRAEIVREKMAYGLLNQLVSAAGTPEEILMKAGIQKSGGESYSPSPGRYELLCPEDLFNLSEFGIHEEDKVVNIAYLDGLPPGTGVAGYLNLGEEVDLATLFFYQKFVNHTAPADLPANANAQLGEEHEIIVKHRYYQGDGDSIPFNPADVSEIFMEQSAHQAAALYQKRGEAANLSILILDIDETAGGSKAADIDTDPRALLVAIKRTNNNPYGGLDQSSLSNTVYVPTGHFQIVDDDVLADIFDGARYVFNNIDVYGGDTFIGMFDVVRLLKDIDNNPSGLSHAVIVPIETRINLDLRSGRHISKDLASKAQADTKIRREVGYHRWEEFNYNDGYSTDSLQNFFVALPYNFQLISDFDTRHRFSLTKNYGEVEDSFRVYGSANLIDVASQHGPIANVRAKFSRLIYWQRDVIGYIPVGERALSASDVGIPIQLGVSGRFERYDQVITNLGNSNQFGLVESFAGFHWYDSIRKMFVNLSGDMKLGFDSIVKGLDSFFTGTIPNIISDDNPVHGYGLLGSYDIRHKIAFLTFKLPGYTETVGYDIKNDVFVGFFDINPSISYNFKDWWFVIENKVALPSLIYNSGIGIPGMYHGSLFNQSFTVIIKDQEKLEKIFDSFKYIGNENIFTSIQYQNEDQSVTESTSGNRNYEYRNRRWYGNFPKVDRERFVGGYLKVTFINSNMNSVIFNELETEVRKMI